MKQMKIVKRALVLGFLPLLVSCGSNSPNVTVVSPPIPDTPVTETPAEPVVPRYEVVPCVAPATDADECGFLIVPEDRSDPDSNTIKVHISTFYPDDGVSSSNTPTIFLQGGPGASNYEYYTFFGDVNSPLHYLRNGMAPDANLVLIDQRGTNMSEPALYCAALDAPGVHEAVSQGTWREEGEGRRPILEGCYNEYLAQGIALSGFNTVENATDIRDLVDVMDWGQVNVYSASYGTRLAMIAMKLYPEIFRAVVLDSILPPEINPFVKESPGTMEGINALFRVAKADYPAIEEVFYKLSAKLHANPVQATSTTNPPQTFTLGAPVFVDYVTTKLRSTPYDDKLPSEIYDMYFNENYSYLADRWLGRIAYDYAGGDANTSDNIPGFFPSVFAANDAFYTSPAQIEAEIVYTTEDEGIREWLRHEFIYKRPSIMDEWPVEILPISIRNPLVSDLPTLMAVGELDVATPSLFSLPSQYGLSDSSYFVIQGAGHGTGVRPCMMDMTVAFFTDPAAPREYLCEMTYTWTNVNGITGQETP